MRYNVSRWNNDQFLSGMFNITWEEAMTWFNYLVSTSRQGEQVKLCFATEL